MQIGPDGKEQTTTTTTTTTFPDAHTTGSTESTESTHWYTSTTSKQRDSAFDLCTDFHPGPDQRLLDAAAPDTSTRRPNDTPQEEDQAAGIQDKPSRDRTQDGKDTTFRPWDDFGRFLNHRDRDLDFEQQWQLDHTVDCGPSLWNPEDLHKQTTSLGDWNEERIVPTRIHDLVCPLLSDDAHQRQPSIWHTGHSSATGRHEFSNADDWPFRSPPSFRKTAGLRRKTPPHSFPAASKRTFTSAPRSVPCKRMLIDSDRHSMKNSKGTVCKDDDDDKSSDKDNSNNNNSDIRRQGATKPRAGAGAKTNNERSSNKEGEETQPVEAWRMRETWKSSGHNRASDGDADKPDSSDGKKSRRSSDLGPSKPTRSSSIRPDAESTDVDMDRPPMKPKSRNDVDHDRSDPSTAMPRRGGRPARQASSTSGSVSSIASDSIESENQEEGLDDGSFHQLVQDSDKPRSKSRERRTRGARAPRRRPSKEEEPNADFYEEVVAVETQQMLKSDDGDQASAPGSGGARRKPWRDRRAANRLSRDGPGSSGNSTTPDRDGGSRKPAGNDRLTLSGGRKSSARRTNMRRSHSERWRNNVESEFADNGDSIQRRARASLVQANAELSKSAHAGKRPTPRRGAGLAMGTASFHEMNGGRRRARAKSNESIDSGSFHDDSYDAHDSNEGSGRSRRTLDSIEDLEDFEHIDFQTPGMIDYDDELLDLMQRANPEDTAQLNRRVHRQRDRLEYDQNMPMMTRQALMTRQGSTQVMRQRFDASNMDKKRILLRNDSMNAATPGDDGSRGQHRMRPGSGGRRAPPRTRSSGLAGLSASALKRQSARHEDGPDRRQLFRTRSTNTNSFQQYMNKPNKVAQLSRRAPASGESMERHSHRGAGNANLSAAKDRRRTLQRAKSTTSLKRGEKAEGADADADAETARADPVSEKESGRSRLVSPEHASAKSGAATAAADAADPAVKRKDRSADSQLTSSAKAKTKDAPSKPATEKKVEKEAPSKPAPSTNQDHPPSKPRPSQKSPRKPPKRTKSVPVRPTTMVSPILRRKTTRRDMTKKSQRQILHAMMYEQKMGISMKDLHKKVKKGPKTRENPLMITAP